MPSPHLTPPRPWQRLSDDEWLALLPHVHRAIGPGRPLVELRQRFDAIFHVAAGAGPWCALPAALGRAETVSRHFRRLTHAGLWHRLLRALAATPPGHPLRALECWICRACRRAYRIAGLALVVLIRRLGFHSALRGPAHMLPDPDLSERLHAIRLPVPDKPGRAGFWALAILAGTLRRGFRQAGGRRHVPRALQWA